MKATFVLIADNETSNFGNQLMYEANTATTIGFEMARLPLHVSLKQPFMINNLNEVESLFDSFALSCELTRVEFDSLALYPTEIFGYNSGCMALGVKPTNSLLQMQHNLFTQLEANIGKCQADHDENYWFHMTVAIGGGSFNDYETAYKKLKLKEIPKHGTFNKLGLLYYEDDNYKPGSYFCYKTINLNHKERL